MPAPRTQRRPARIAHTAFALLAAMVLDGCRDAVPPFQPAQREYAPPTWALTYGPGSDTDPHWSVDGDTVLYHTTLLGLLPAARGVLAGIPRAGGAALPVLADIQAGQQRFVTPARSSAGDHIAYVDLLGIDFPCSDACAVMQPLLDSAVLRVRRVGETHAVSFDPRTTIRFPGTSTGYRSLEPGTWAERLFPFQARHRAEAAYVFRPSWAPDGDRLAFSDGVAIRVWRIGDDTTSIVPGTDDGMSAAWSPTGEWIAFTMIARTDSTVAQCDCGPDRTAVRTDYVTSDPVIVIVRPDGSESIELGPGDDPAWSPDGTAIYARRAGMIVRISLDGGAAVPVANTERGRAPAVSPDGRWLAFSRTKAPISTDHDIWITALDP